MKHGGVSELAKEPVQKTGSVKAPVGSNPTPVAIADSPSGKAAGFDPAIHRFDSGIRIHLFRQDKPGLIWVGSSDGRAEG